MSSYGFTPGQVGGIIKVTDKVSNSARQSMVGAPDGFKRFSLRPTSMDIFSLYGKSESKSRPTTTSYEKMDYESLKRPELATRPSWTDSVGSSGSDSEKTLCEKRNSVSSRFKKRASQVFGYVPVNPR